MAERVVTLTLQVSADQAQAALDRFNASEKQAAESSRNLGQSVDEQKGFMESLSSSLQTAETAIVALGAAYATFDQAISAGEDVVRVNAAFEAMAGSAQAAAEGQQQLADATRGLVDDETAMAGATRLLSLGLADNTKQAADFVGVGAQLGRVFNGDAASGISTFINVLQNESPRALAQFGISSDDVKKKVDALTASGMDAREAFRQVVLQEANDKLKALGDNAVMAGSAWERLKIQVQDAVENIEASAAQSVEGIVGIAQLAGQVITGTTKPALDSAQEIEDKYTHVAEAVQQVFENTSLSNGTAGAPSGASFGLDPQMFALVEAGADRAREALGRVNVSAQEVKDTIEQTTGMPLLWSDEDMARVQYFLDQYAGAGNTIQQQQEQINANTVQQAQLLVAAVQQQNQMADFQQQLATGGYTEVANARAMQAALNDVGMSQRDLNTQVTLENQQRQRNLDALNSFRNVMSDVVSYAQQQSDIFNQVTGAQQQNEAALQRLDQQRVNMTLQRPGGSFNGVSLFSDADATRAENIANSTKEIYEQIAARAQQYPNLVSSEDVDNARNVADNAARFADQAQRGADTFDNMTLPDFFGQTSGGTAGDVVNQIETFLQNEGQNTDQLRQIKDAMELVTGQQTSVSQSFQNTILPELANIAQNMGGAAGGQAAQAYADYIQNSTLNGTAITQSGANSAISTAVYGQGQAVGIGASSEVAASYGGPAPVPLTEAQALSNALDDSATSTGRIVTDTESIAGNINTAQLASNGLSTNFDKVQKATAGVKSDLQAMTAGIKLVQVMLSIVGYDDQTGVLAAVLKGAGANNIIAAANPTSSQGVGVGQAAPGGIAGSGRGR